MPTTNSPTKTRSKSNEYVAAVGRRKTATARVHLFSKSGDMIVNDKPIGKYFSGDIDSTRYLMPFVVTNTVGKFSFTIKVVGSGKMSQLGAVIHGLSRALVEVDKDAYKSLLKKAGLLTRDSRMKESRKVGTGGKARRAKQSPKR